MQGGGEASALRPLGVFSGAAGALRVAAYSGRQGVDSGLFSGFRPRQSRGALGAALRVGRKPERGVGVLELVGGPVALKPLGSWEEALGFFLAGGLLGRKATATVTPRVPGGGGGARYFV